MITLKNNHLHISIDEQRAEIVSVKPSNDSHEFMWNGDPKYWSKHSPILFPIVGRLNGDRYLLNGTSYKMTNHGFGYSETWKLDHADTTGCQCTLTESEETLSMFPFRFSLSVHFVLHKETIYVRFCLINRDRSALFFSLGYHPGFACPGSGENFLDEYQLRFERSENPIRLENRGGYLTGDRTNLAAGRFLTLSPDLFTMGRKAMILDGLQSQHIKLLHTRTGRSIICHRGNFTWLNVWCPSPAAQLLCIEPIEGLTSPETFDGDIREKPGTQTLRPLQTAEYWCAFTFKI